MQTCKHMVWRGVPFLVNNWRFLPLCRLKTNFQTSLNASSACGRSGLSLGEKRNHFLHMLEERDPDFVTHFYRSVAGTAGRD